MYLDNQTSTQRKMKNLFLAVFLCSFFGLGANAQTRFGNVRCDSFKVTVDTSRAVIYRKKKTGVFDQKTNKFLIKPTKDVIFYYDQIDYYLRIGKKEITPIKTDKEGVLQRIENANPDTLMLDFECFSKYYTSTEVEMHAYRNENLIYLQNNREPFANLNHFDIPVVIDSGCTKSGIYDLDERKWLIPPIYESCYWEDDFVFCLKRELGSVSEHDFEIEKNYTYDIYRIGDNDMTLVLQDIYKDAQIEVSEIFGCDSASVTADSSYFTTWQGGKQGLVKFSLFHDADSQTGKPIFALQKVLDEKFDFVLLGLDYGYVMTYEKNAENGIVAYIRSETDEGIKMKEVVSAKDELVWGTLGTGGMYSQEGQYLFKDDKNFISVLADSTNPGKGRMWVEDELERSIKSDMDEVFLSKAAGLRVLDDKYLQVVHFKNDSVDLFAIPYHTVLGEDSIVYDEESGFFVHVYPGPIPGYFHSGVFDYSNGEWFASPKYKMIYRNEQGFLLESFKFQEEAGHVENNLYSFMANSGNFVFEEELITAVESHISYLLNGAKSDRVVDFPERGGLIGDRENPGDYYYVQNKDGTWQVHQPVPDLYYVNPYPLTEPKEFVHYNPYYDYYFWLEQDSIHLEIYGSIYSVPADQGKIRLLIEDVEEMFEFAVESIYGTDTSVYKSYLFQDEENLAEIYIKDGKLIINENQVYDNISPYEEYFDGFEYELNNDISFIRFQTETSSVWEKKDGVWTKQTPYYAYIEPIPFGYIVNTGDHEEIIDIFSHESIDIKGRCLILDKNFKAMSFFDFYDFKWAFRYDEGIMICLGQGCFFVNNEGKILTNPEWSDFEIENGKLKAIKYNEMDEEWWWEDPEEMIEKVEYFELE